jgi:hypothetical protein
MPNRSDPTKKLKLGDYVEVLVPLGKDEDGNPTYEKGIVSRAGLSDEKWADVKARAEASGRLSTIKESEQTRGGDSTPEGDVIRFKDKSGGTVVVPRGDLDESAWMKRVSDAADKDSFESATIDGEVTGAGPKRAKKVGTDDLADEGATPVTARRVGGDGSSLGSGAGVTLSVDEGAPNERPVQKPMLTNPGQREPVIDEQASAGGTMGGKIRGMFGGMAEGALPGGTGGGVAPMSMPAPGPGMSMTDGGVPTSDGGVGMPTPPIAPSPMGVSGGAAPDAGMPAPSMGLSSPPSEPSAPMPNMGNVNPTPLTNPVDLAVADKMSSGGTAPMSGQMSAPDPSTIVGAPQASMAPPGYKAEVGVKTRGTSTPAPAGISSLDQAEKDFRAGQKTAIDTAQKGADEQLKARADYESKSAAFEAAQVKAQGLQRQEEDRINSAYLQTLEEVSKKQQIDPDHFWDSKSAGQKAFMAIGGFLAGLGGRDPSGRIDQMIAQDIAVQRENYNLAREGAKNKLAGLNTMYGRLRERGLDDREAAAAARAAMNQGMANKLQGIAEQMAPGEARSKAEMAIAQFQLNKTKAQEDLKMGAAQRAHMRKQDLFEEVKLGMAAETARAKAKEESPMQATLSKEMAAIEDGMAQARQMLSDSSVGTWEKVKTAAAGGSYGKAWEAIAKFADPNAGARSMDFKGKRIGMLKDIFGGALQAHELAEAEGMLPDTISPMTDLRPYFERIVAFGQQQIARRQERYSRSGADQRGPAAPGAGGSR